MLSAILKSNKAIHISIQIIQAFVLMRKTGMQLDGFKQRLALVERKQISHEAKFEQVFKALESADHIPNQGIFFNGQIFDAYKFAADIIKKAKQSIILIDNNIDESTLALLSKRDNHVKAMIYSEKMNLTLKNDLAKLAEQYPTIEFRILKNNHDRFIIIDQKEMYHLGDSLKDLGKKMFAFSRMDAETKLLLSVLDKS